MRRAAAAALCLAPLAGAADAAAQARIGPAQRAAQAIVRQASAHVARAIDECRPKPIDAPAIVDGEPSDAMKSVLGVFRRPPTDEELALADTFERRPNGNVDAIYRRGFRRVTAANGVQFTLIAAARFSAPSPPAAVQRRCVAAIRTRALRRAHRRSARIRRATRRLLRSMARGIHEPTPPAEGILMQRPAAFIDGTTTNGNWFGDFFLRRGLFSAGSGSDRAKARIDMVVPDGVADVILDYAATKRQPAASVTAPVGDNVASVEVPRDAGPAFRATVTWRAADGSVVKQFKNAS